jgi:hypothetical protein
MQHESRRCEMQQTLVVDLSAGELGAAAAAALVAEHLKVKR